MLPALTFLAILAALIAVLYLGNKLYKMVKQDALESARVEIGRELKMCAAYFSHSPETVRALETAAEMALCGCEIDGAEVKRELEEGE